MDSLPLIFNKFSFRLIAQEKSKRVGFDV